jgi:hypothetical protein
MEIVPGSFLLSSFKAIFTSLVCWEVNMINAVPNNSTITITGINRKRRSLLRVLLFMDELVWGSYCGQAKPVQK